MMFRSVLLIEPRAMLAASVVGVALLVSACAATGPDGPRDLTPEQAARDAVIRACDSYRDVANVLEGIEDAGLLTHEMSLSFEGADTAAAEICLATPLPATWEAVGKASAAIATMAALKLQAESGDGI